MSIAKRPRWCRHHTKPKPLTDGCAIGLDPRGDDVYGKGPPGGWFRLPCHDQWQDDCGEKRSCSSYDPFTDEEIAQQDDERHAAAMEAVKMINAVTPLAAKIKREHRGKSARGVASCPICAAKLRWTHAATNGHISMRCTTEDCIAFME